ncbi:ferritin-like domain-containing protein [Halarcobacter anaerophilus]|uniref:DUF2202 domain-containing protein n=1 Tax=Halarcobacter anaerophilus TaxID=877500 RepID=A0A4Q0XZ41_9BACT|nr:DUF2202 domain-containing protein [Halarcobacter anaerophilus]QDF28277.1 ferritin-like protein (DUF2202 domain) [Halarcobacter anaerophilus]RXJ62054.1 DUF2202 domain-containing protein [Halarcobacter anaerophilus]
MQENIQENTVTQEQLETKQDSIIKNFDEDLLKGLRVDPNYNEPVLDQVLRIAIYDEYHAYETYRKILEKFGNVSPFSNILEAEIRHYQELALILEKHQVPMPVNDWEGKIEAPNSLLEASEIAVAAEIDNIKMYDNLISYAKDYPDVLDTLYRMQAASYNNHLPSFRQAVINHSSSDTQVNVNEIYQQYSQHNIDEAISKMDEFGQMASKFASGQVTQEDMLKLLSNTNLSFIGGALLGAVGAGVLSQMTKEKSEDIQEDEEV